MFLRQSFLLSLLVPSSLIFSGEPQAPLITLTHAHLDRAHYALFLPNQFSQHSGWTKLSLSYKVDRLDSESKTWAQEILATNATKKPLHCALFGSLQNPQEHFFVKVESPDTVPTYEHATPLNLYTLQFNEQEQLQLTTCCLQEAPVFPHFFNGPAPEQLFADLQVRDMHISYLQSLVDQLQQKLSLHSPSATASESSSSVESEISDSALSTSEHSSGQNGKTPDSILSSPAAEVVKVALPSVETSEQKPSYALIAAHPAITPEKQNSIIATGQKAKNLEIVTPIKTESTPAQKSRKRFIGIPPTPRPVILKEVDAKKVVDVVPTVQPSVPVESIQPAKELATTSEKPKNFEPLPNPTLSPDELQKRIEQAALDEKAQQEAFTKMSERRAAYLKNKHEQQQQKLKKSLEKEETEAAIVEQFTLHLNNGAFEEANTLRKKITSYQASLLAYAKLYPFAPTPLAPELHKKRSHIEGLISSLADPIQKDFCAYFLALTSATDKEKKQWLAAITTSELLQEAQTIEESIENIQRNHTTFQEAACLSAAQCLHRSLFKSLRAEAQKLPLIINLACFKKLKARICGSVCPYLALENETTNHDLQTAFREELETIQDAEIRKEITTFFESIRTPAYDSDADDRILAILGAHGPFLIVHRERGAALEKMLLTDEQLAENITTLSKAFSDISKADTSTNKKFIHAFFYRLQDHMTEKQIAKTILDNRDQRWPFFLLVQSRQRFETQQFESLSELLKDGSKIINTDFPRALNDIFTKKTAHEIHEELVKLFGKYPYSLHHFFIQLLIPYAKHPEMTHFLETLIVNTKQLKEYSLEQKAMIAKQLGILKRLSSAQ